MANVLIPEVTVTVRLAAPGTMAIGTWVLPGNVKSAWISSDTITTSYLVARSTT